MSKKHATIKIEYSEGSLFGGWENMDAYDAAASMARYGDLVLAAVRAEYPQTDIEVRSGINDRVTVWNNDDSRREEEIKIGVDEILAEIYQDEDWAVEK